MGGPRRSLLTQGESLKSRMMTHVMIEAQAEKTSYSSFDLTKVWSHKVFPPIEVGIVELTRNPDNYYAQVAQFDFSSANVVPGINHSRNKMIPFRIFSDVDTHRYRLEVNYENLPVNKPRLPVRTPHRDYSMGFDGRNYGGAMNYEPNSFDGPVEDLPFKEPSRRLRVMPLDPAIGREMVNTRQREICIGCFWQRRKKGHKTIAQSMTGVLKVT